MFSHVLIPTDGSDLAGRAVEKGLALAGSVGAQVTFLIVVEPFRVFAVSPKQGEAAPEEYAVQSKLHARDILDAAEARADAAGIVASSVEIDGDEPWRAIIETAERRRCDLIAMASHGRRGIAAVVLGSQTLKVLTHSDVPVLVYR